uniref:coiled-coil domain-containing protein 40 n=1 Tax=Centroberyx gerrardi TaxID=166262 RepID=UPI003AAAC844
MENGGSKGGGEEGKEEDNKLQDEREEAPEGSEMTCPPTQEGVSEDQSDREQPGPESGHPAFQSSQSSQSHSGADEAYTAAVNSVQESVAQLPVTPRLSYLNASEDMEDQGPLVEEEDEDEEEELIILDPEHPLVRRFQAALNSRLSKQLERLNFDLREKLAMEKAETSHKDQLCAELYGVQEQLARLQARLEDSHHSTAQAAAERRQAQDRLEAVKGQYHSTTSQASKERTHVSQLQAEIENLMLRLFYMQDVNADLRSYIDAMKNATRKAGAEKTQAEDQKYKQDLYVERLTKDMERLMEQIAMYEAQAAAQAQETQAAKEALSEAQMEMDSLVMERKQLLQQWDSSLVGMRKRDEAFTALQEALRVAKHQVISMDRETEGYKKSITKEEEQNEVLTMQLKWAQMDSATSKRLISQSQAQQEALQAHYSTYIRTLQETERTLARLNMESSAHQVEVSALRRQLEKESGVRLELEDKIMAQMQQELTHDKAAKYSQRLTNKMATFKKERISQLWQLENEVAAVGLESSEVSQRLDSLALIHEALEQEIAKRNKLLTACQTEIANCVTVIERKQAAISAFNKKIQQIAASAGHVDLSPLQIQAESMSKQLEELAADIKRDRQLWMWQQEVLVGLTQERQANSKDMLKLQTKYTVLQQRKIRTESQIEAEGREQAELERCMKMLRGDMLKLNSLLSKNGQLGQALEQENTLMETDFLHRLKEAERQSVEMQMKLEKTLEEKERLINSLVEAERQIMLWEKKTQLTRETRSAVDSDVGQGDICMMKAEVHRMEVRHSQLMKQQERLLRESEATVSRRENVVLRREAQARSFQKQTTHSDLNRIVQGLRRNIQDTHKHVAECEQVIRELQESQVGLSGSLVQKKQQLTELRGTSFVLDSDLLNLQDTKDRNLARLVALQSRTKQLQAVRGGSYTALSTSETVEAALQRQEERVHTVSIILYRVCEELPQHQGELRRLSLTLAAQTQAQQETS